MSAQNTTNLKDATAASIRTSAGSIFTMAEALYKTPELGFREHRTSEMMAEHLAARGLRTERGLAVTGVRAVLDTGRPGPRVAVLAELDALPLQDHPDADPHTGAVHACGHHAQLTHLLALANAFTSIDIERHLVGQIVFLAVPAEEYVDFDFRLGLVERGQIEFLGGKAQLIVEGAFEGIDMAMMVHATGRSEDGALAVRSGMNGLMAKSVRFVGRASHAGMAPHRGVNALNAASLALHAIHLQRETFIDDDHVRVHPIISRGGDTVNVVPADVRLELFVRAATREALIDASSKVDRSLRAGAGAVGAGGEINNLGGYLPLVPHPPFEDLFVANGDKLMGAAGTVRRLGPVGGSTDAGDLSHLIPVLHAFHGGCGGMNHAEDFHVSDPELTYIRPAIAMAWTIIDLLSDDGAEARMIMDSFKPNLTTEGYLELMRSMRETHEFSPI